MKSGVRIVFMVAAFIVVTPVLVLCAESKGTVSEDVRHGVNVAATVSGVGMRGSRSDVDGGQLQPAVPVQSGGARSGATPKVELFLGYSYLRAVPTLSSGNRLVWLHGGSTSVAFNLNHFLGLVGDFGGFANSELNLTGPGANPAGVVGSGGSAYTYLFGPRFSYRGQDRLVPFGQALFGGIHASPVTLSGCTGASCTPLRAQSAFALTAGGGLDLRIHRRLSLRLVQAEYLMTRFADPTTGNGNMQNDIRLSAGLVFGLGGKPESVPVAYTCVATPASVFAGDPISVTGTALNLNPKRTAVYGWKLNAGKISGTAEVANVDTAGIAPGNYTAYGHVSEGAKPGQFADCSASFTVMAQPPAAVTALQAPSVTCSADPSPGHPGESIIITALGVSPQNRPLTYSYAASDGTIRGNTAMAVLTTTVVTPPIKVTCMVADDKGQTGAATVTVVIVARPVPAAPPTQKLCSIQFERDAKRPTRVDNEAKACLDDIALNLQRSSDATLALLGGGSVEDAAQRATNTKAYLVTEKGIDPSRIVTYTGPSGSKTVDTIMIPPGAILDMSGLTPVSNTSKPIARRAAAPKEKGHSLRR